MALRDQKPRAFCTYWDVVSLAQQISTEKIDVSEQLPYLFSVVKYKAQVEQFITQVDAMIWAKLRMYFPIGTILGAVSDSRATVPSPGNNNQGDTELISVLLNNEVVDDVYTAAWTLHFTNSHEYNIYSSLEATQGTGWDIDDATNTSSNGEVTIQSDFWVENQAEFVRGDRLYFSVLRVHPFIQYCSNLLATSLAIVSLYVSESPNASEFGNTLWRRGMELIHQLVIAAEGGAIKDVGDNMLVGAALDDFVPSWDKSTISIDYEITALGQDRSPYLQDNDGVLMFGDGDPYIG